MTEHYGRPVRPLLDGTTEAAMAEQVSRLWPDDCGTEPVEPRQPVTAPLPDVMPLADFMQVAAARMLIPPGPTVYYVHPDQIRAGDIPDPSFPLTSNLMQALMRAEWVADRNH